MANQELLGKTYQIPPEVIKGIQASLVSNPQGDGVKRAKNIAYNGYMTYEAMKKWKHDMQNLDRENDIQYKLGGGVAMERFIEATLNQERAGVKRSKDVRQDMTNDMRPEPPSQAAPVLNEEKKDLDKNAVAVIINNDNKILLLKRGDDPNIWQPNKWALVGGGIEKGEDAETACKREIKEETGLEIEKFIESFTIQRREDSEETIFACRYDGDPTDIELDTSENTNYGWYDVTEMDYLEIVPHLIEYITLVFKNYD